MQMCIEHTIGSLNIVDFQKKMLMVKHLLKTINTYLLYLLGKVAHFCRIPVSNKYLLCIYFISMSSKRKF